MPAGPAEVLAAAKACAEAGARCLCIFRPSDSPGIATLARGIHAPVSILATADSPRVPGLQGLGVAPVSYSAPITRAAIAAVKCLAAALLGGGDPRPLLRGVVPREEFFTPLPRDTARWEGGAGRAGRPGVGRG